MACSNVCPCSRFQLHHGLSRCYGEGPWDRRAARSLIELFFANSLIVLLILGLAKGKEETVKQDELVLVLAPLNLVHIRTTVRQTDAI